MKCEICGVKINGCFYLKTYQNGMKKKIYETNIGYILKDGRNRKIRCNKCHCTRKTLKGEIRLEPQRQSIKSSQIDG